MGGNDHASAEPRSRSSELRDSFEDARDVLVGVHEVVRVGRFVSDVDVVELGFLSERRGRGSSVGISEE